MCSGTYNKKLAKNTAYSNKLNFTSEELKVFQSTSILSKFRYKLQLCTNDLKRSKRQIT